MTLNRLVTLVLLSVLAACNAKTDSAVAAVDAKGPAENGLLARYRMQTVTGARLGDESGNGHACRIHGATLIGSNGNRALAFDGVSSYVDCGSVMSGQNGPFTFTTWIAPALNQTSLEAGIVGGGFHSQLLSLVDGPLQSSPYDAIFGYDGGTGNNANISVHAGGWLHAALTYDGHSLTLYLDGARVAQHAILDHADGAARLYLGANSESGGGFYKGLMSDTSIYSRALSADEVAAQYAQQGTLDRDLLLQVPATHLKSVLSVNGDSYTVQVDAHGALEIGDGASFFTVESAFSYPGAVIGWNGFRLGLESWEQGWLPDVKRSGGGFTIAAQGHEYSVVRQVVPANGRIDITDTLISNTPGEDQPINIIHTLTSGEKVTTLALGETADNPLAAFTEGTQLVGWVDNDTLGRAKLRSDRAGYAVNVRHQDYFIAAGESYTFKSSIYLLPASSDLFDLANRVRDDWKANVTMQGSLTFFDPSSPLLNSPIELKAYLDRLGANIVVGGWIPKYVDTTDTLAQFAGKMRSLAAAVRAARPGTRVIGALESDWAAIDPATLSQASAIVDLCKPSGVYADGYYAGSPAATAAIKAAGIYADSLRLNNDIGRNIWIECYSDSPDHPNYALGVNAVVGNQQHQHRIDEARFILDQAGLDGLYIDDFSQDFGSGAYNFGGYDGSSGLIDSATGQLSQYYANPTVQGIGSRVGLIQQANPSQVVVANTFATSPDEQGLPVSRFREIELYLDPTPLRPGIEPPFQLEMAEGLLATPLGLGMIPPASDADLAQELMLGILSYLRHGKLYYHEYPLLPTSGFGSGDYGPVPHMFPFTPIELHNGWVKGKERIVAGRSFSTSWIKSGPPIVSGFDLHGRTDPTIAAKCTISGSSPAWQVRCALSDWNELVAIE